MSDTRTLLNKISSFRRRLEEMPPLMSESASNSEGEPESPLPESPEPERAVAGSGTQVILEETLRRLKDVEQPAHEIATPLTARSIRLLQESRAIITSLRELAEEPLLSGPPPDHVGVAEEDSLVLYFRETAAMMDPAIRIAQHLPETPSLQLRLCEGWEGILTAVQGRIMVIHRALTPRKREAERIEMLARIFLSLDAGVHLDCSILTELADEILAESPISPLRFTFYRGDATQQFLGGIRFVAPALHLAAHSLMTGRVLARMIRHAPEWRSKPHGPIIAAMLQDVGMLRVPSNIFTQSQRLTGEQRRAIEAHPQVSAETIANLLPELHVLADAVAAHHERLDGSGYPARLKEADVPPLSRLLAVADTYVAMCAPRAHRRGRDPRTALTDVLLSAEENRLDRFVAEKLLVIGLYPIGSIVELVDGSVGAIAAHHHGPNALYLANRPVVNLLIDSEGMVLPMPQPTDLAEMDSVSVVRTLPREERDRLLGRFFPELV